MLLKTLPTMLCALLGVAFLTLLERKILSYLQNRKGPNKVGPMGLFQPFSDALKLFMKELILPFESNKSLFCVLPVISLSIGLLLWGLLPSTNSFAYPELSVLLFVCISSINVYIVMGAGWTSNSVYAFLGSMRASAQTISYEISLVFILLLPCLLVLSLDMCKFINAYPVVCLVILSAGLWMVTCLAETNRAPFDFAEGESELVSGFNVEYGGGLFALLFLGEYAVILYMSMMTSACFINVYNVYLYVMGGLWVAMSFLLIRGVFPRYRYDKLMNMCWKAILPLSMSLLCVVFVARLLNEL